MTVDGGTIAQIAVLVTAVAAAWVAARKAPSEQRATRASAEYSTAQAQSVIIDDLRREIEREREMRRTLEQELTEKLDRCVRENAERAERDRRALDELRNLNVNLQRRVAQLEAGA